MIPVPHHRLPVPLHLFLDESPEQTTACAKGSRRVSDGEAVLSYDMLLYSLGLYFRCSHRAEL